MHHSFYSFLPGSYFFFPANFCSFSFFGQKHLEWHILFIRSFWKMILVLPSVNNTTALNSCLWFSSLPLWIEVQKHILALLKHPAKQQDVCMESKLWANSVYTQALQTFAHLEKGYNSVTTERLMGRHQRTLEVFEIWVLPHYMSYKLIN